jgi:hypothetical protein
MPILYTPSGVKLFRLLPDVRLCLAIGAKYFRAVELRLMEKQ